MIPTERQLKILKHALGWPKNYRNHFCTGPGSKDYDDCEALYAGGLMSRSQLSWVPDYTYAVTEKGRVALIDALEKAEA